MSSRARFPLRAVVLALALAEALIGSVFIILMLRSSDPLGKAIGEGMAKLAVVPFAICVLPGLGLGLSNRALVTALLLLLAAIPIAGFLWLLA